MIILLLLQVMYCACMFCMLYNLIVCCTVHSILHAIECMLTQHKKNVPALYSTTTNKQF